MHQVHSFLHHYNEAIVLTADGVGEWATTTIAIGKGIII